ncbi:MAG: 4Fe-4S dicluster domain-containing protein [Desulfobacterales bacterium]|nr:4Fe-4S dicluster domain-containing protein [Desulfobacterales bacterium]
MNNETKLLDIGNLAVGKLKSFPFFHDFCITCGLCSSACPVSGVEGFDPRKIVRLVSLGLEDEAILSKWPWICTMCGKCENLCPIGVDISGIVRKIRSFREREKVPGVLQSGLESVLKTGNNLSLPKDDYIFILEDIGDEIKEEEGFNDFEVPIDKKGANIMLTIHNKLVNTHTEDLKHWFKIFHAAKENWTISSENWEGTNWAYFTGDDDSMKILCGRFVEQMERLEIKYLLWPE